MSSHIWVRIEEHNILLGKQKYILCSGVSEGSGILGKNLTVGYHIKYKKSTLRLFQQFFKQGKKKLPGKLFIKNVTQTGSCLTVVGMTKKAKDRENGSQTFYVSQISLPALFVCM